MFRGDNTKDAEGYLAVFSEQGTSASNQAAAKFLDAISKMPGNDGEDADATGAYTQSDLDGPETWITLPQSQWPKSWKGKYTKPVVHLNKSLYGHPLAGLYWEKHCRKGILSCGFEPVPGWECLYMHRSKRLFLSSYVDDFKMAGPKDHLKPMWAAYASILIWTPR